MDRNREVRRSAIAASDGLLTRRQRSSVLRESLDDGDVEMQEGLTLRDRVETRERDRNSLNRSKRRRSERFSQRNQREEGEESSEESLVDEELSRNAASYQQSHCRSFPPFRVSMHAATPSLKVAGEMIGVPVPRKARSACVKRSHDCRTSSGSGGFGEEFRRDPASPASQSFEAGSPFSSNASVKQRMPIGFESRLPTLSESSSSPRDELEIEIAEVLSGLKKQAQSSNKEDNAEKSLKSSEFKEAIGVHHKTDVVALKKMKMEISTEKLEKMASMGSQDEAMKQDEPKPSVVEESGGGDTVESIQVPTVKKGVYEVPKVKSQREDDSHNNYNSNNFMIDLMASPSMPSTQERDTMYSIPERDTFAPLASDSKPKAQYSSMENLVEDGVKIAVKQETPIESGRKKVQNQEWLKLDLEKPSQDDAKDNSINLQNQGQRQHQPAKGGAPKPEKMAKLSSVPLSIGAQLTGLPPPGYMPPLQIHKPIEGFTGTSPAAQKPAQLISSQPWPKRCATHCYIARNIRLHQQFVKTNHLWPANTGSVSLTGSGLRPDNLNVIPPASAETLILGNQSFQGSFPDQNQIPSAQDKGRIATNTPTQKDKTSETTQKKPQSSAAVRNLLPGPAFIFPISHQQLPVSATSNQTMPSISVASTKNPTLVSNPSSVCFNYPADTNGHPFQVSNLPAIKSLSHGQALPFFNGPFYSPQMFHPSQLQQQQQKAKREKGTSIGSTSAHKQPHSQVGAKNGIASSTNVHKQHLSSPSHQSYKLETKFNGERSVDGQSLTVPLQPSNFSVSFGSMNSRCASSNLNFSSKGHHLVPTAQRADSKIDDGKKGILGKPPAMPNGQTLVFDNSARTLSFVSGTWPRAITSNYPVSTTLPNTTQQLQIQKHNLPQEQQQQQPQSGRSKSIALNNPLPASSIAAKFHNSVSVFSQAQAQANSVLSQPTQRKTSAASSSLAACSSLNLKQVQQQNIATQGGQIQISFAGNSKPDLVQSLTQSQTCLAVGSPPHGEAISSGINKTGSLVSASQPQQTENSETGSGQKSSPVCGRNVPSIISSCPSHLSELKY